MNRDRNAGGAEALSGGEMLLALLIATWLVASAWQVPPAALTGTRRGPRGLVSGKHVAVYLVHVVFGIRKDVTARLFGQDRRTVARACAHIEDLRDDGAADRQIDDLEHAAVALARQLGLGVAARNPRVF